MKKQPNSGVLELLQAAQSNEPAQPPALDLSCRNSGGSSEMRILSHAKLSDSAVGYPILQAQVPCMPVIHTRGTLPINLSALPTSLPSQAFQSPMHEHFLLQYSVPRPRLACIPLLTCQF